MIVVIAGNCIVELPGFSHFAQWWTCTLLLLGHMAFWQGRKGTITATGLIIIFLCVYMARETESWWLTNVGQVKINQTW